MALALASCLYGPASAMPLAPGDILDAFSQVAPRTGERFEPALGFLDEAGVTRSEGNVGWWHRTEAGQDIVPGIDWNLRRRLDGSERSWLFNPELELVNAAGDYLLPEVFV